MRELIKPVVTEEPVEELDDQVEGYLECPRNYVVSCPQDYQESCPVGYSSDRTSGTDLLF